MPMRLAGAMGVAALIASCAQVNVVQVDSKTGRIISGSAEGFRYYLPAPYLLVMQLPDDTPQKENGANSERAAPPKKQSDTGTSGDKQSSSDKPAANQGAGANSSTAVSFGNKNYEIRLIYIKDESKAFAVSIRPGLFGTSSVQFTLQDGWMLTSLNGNSDQKVAETLSSAAQLIGAIYGGGTAAGKAAPSTQQRAGGAVPRNALLPGLYRLVFDNSGVVSDIVLVKALM